MALSGVAFSVLLSFSIISPFPHDCQALPCISWKNSERDNFVFSLVVRSSSSWTGTKLWVLDDFWCPTQGKTTFAFTLPQKEQIFS